jgi:hypothetical protein
MKKIVLLLIALATVASSFAVSSFAIRERKATDVYIPVGADKQISLYDLSTIKVKDFEKLSGRHMNFFNRLSFKIAQKKLQKSINADGTINNKKLEKVLAAGDPSTGFHLGGFALGFLLGLIGVLIAYLLNDDYKKNRVKWAWIGFGVGLILYLILVVALL